MPSLNISFLDFEECTTAKYNYYYQNGMSYGVSINNLDNLTIIRME